MRNEELEAVTGELKLNGLSWETEELGKHLRVCWEYPVSFMGRVVERSVTIARTGSDWRGPLNARANVRRILKGDNWQPPKKEAVLLERALSLPKETDSGPARLAKLETDFAALLDLVGELREENRILAQGMTFLQERFANLRVTVSFDKPSTTEVVSSLKPATSVVAPTPQRLEVVTPKAGTPKGHMGKQHHRGGGTRAIMAALPENYSWVSLAQIRKAAGYGEDLPSQRACAASLFRLKELKRVEGDGNGFYRRARQVPEAAVS